MKSPLKSEGREERNGQTDIEREREGESEGARQSFKERRESYMGTNHEV